MPSVTFDRSQKIVLAATSLLGLIALGLMFNFFQYGFEFTDEGVLLSIIERPREYPTFHLLTGFFFHPLYLLLKGDIVLLRSVTFSIFFILSFLLTRLVLLKTKPADTQLSGIWLLAASFCLAFGSLTLFLLWHPSPNYNNLNFIALTVVASGLVMVAASSEKKPTSLSLGSWVVVGIGGYLAFMAKPYTAAALALLVIGWALWARRFQPKGIILAATIAFGLLFISALWIDSSVGAFIERYSAAVKEDNLSGAHDALRPITFILPLLFRNLTKEFMIGFLLLFFGGFCLGPSEKLRKQVRKYTIPMLGLAVFIVYVRYYPYLMWHNYLSGLLVPVPILGLLVYGANKRQENPQRVDRPLFVALLLLTVAYGVGSNNSFFLTTSLASFFTLLALISLLGPFSTNNNYHFRLVSVASLTFLLSIGVVITAIGNPYRQPAALWSYSDEAPVRDGTRPLYFSPLVARYLTNLHRLAQESGLATDTPMIDLTGRAPGVLYALGAYTPGSFWLNSFTPGADRYAVYMLAKAPCEKLARAWILWERIPPTRPLNPAILAPTGLKFPEDYAPVGSVRYLSEFGVDSYYSRPQFLFKPKREPAEAVSICQAARARRR